MFKYFVLNYLNKLFEQFKGAYLEVTVIDDYPLLSVENTDVLKNFISLKMYKENGELIDVKDIKDEIKPEILFPKNGVNYKECIYFDEGKEKLVSDGLKMETTKIDGVEYAVCKLTHFTDFSVEATGLAGWAIFLIVLACLIVVGGIGAFVFFKLRQRKNMQQENQTDQLRDMNAFLLSLILCAYSVDIG